MRVMTFSTTFPSYHPRKGQLTCFVEKIWLGLHQLDIDFMDSDGWKNDTVGQDYNDIIWISKNLPKWHTIRKGHRWKAGDWFQPVIWGNDKNPKSKRSGPYHSKQIKFASPIEVKKVWDFMIDDEGIMLINNKLYWLDENRLGNLKKLCQNDGLNNDDFLAWFQYPKPFDGQIICWNDKIEY